jgi:hypothetical protein
MSGIFSSFGSSNPPTPPAGEMSSWEVKNKIKQAIEHANALEHARRIIEVCWNDLYLYLWGDGLTWVFAERKQDLL